MLQVTVIKVVHCTAAMKSTYPFPSVMNTRCDVHVKGLFVQVDAAAQQVIEQELIKAADEPLPDDGDDELLND